MRRPLAEPSLPMLAVPASAAGAAHERQPTEVVMLCEAERTSVGSTLCVDSNLFAGGEDRHQIPHRTGDGAQKPQDDAETDC